MASLGTEHYRRSVCDDAKKSAADTQDAAKCAADDAAEEGSGLFGTIGDMVVDAADKVSDLFDKAEDATDDAGDKAKDAADDASKKAKVITS